MLSNRLHTLIQSCLNNGNINSNGSSNGLNGSSLSNEKISIENFDEFDEDDPHTSLYMVFQRINDPEVAS